MAFLGAKVNVYGATVNIYGVKSEYLWGDGESLWGAEVKGYGAYGGDQVTARGFTRGEHLWGVPRVVDLTTGRRATDGAK
ncbi:hypothetical protein G6F24_011250 [Rhizopus arrhizus]|nr:hypothetical protein G6F24_011250 [Rhizopus arrhizus]